LETNIDRADFARARADGGLGAEIRGEPGVMTAREPGVRADWGLVGRLPPTLPGNVLGGKAREPVGVSCWPRFWSVRLQEWQPGQEGVTIRVRVRVEWVY